MWTDFTRALEANELWSSTGTSIAFVVSRTIARARTSTLETADVDLAVAICGPTSFGLERCCQAQRSRPQSMPLKHATPSFPSELRALFIPPPICGDARKTTAQLSSRSTKIQ